MGKSASGLKRLYLEITNQCNLNCAFCPLSKRKIEHLPLALIAKVLAESAKLSPYVYLHVLGEPLMYPKFREVLELAEKYQVKLQLVTNGTLLKEYQDVLLTAKALRKLSVSLQSLFTSDNLAEHLLSLNAFIEKAKKTDLIIELRNWTGENPAISTYLKETFGYQDKKLKLRPKLYLSFSETFSWPSLATEVKQQAKYCQGPKMMLCVLSNGVISPCCLDTEGLLNLGNIRDISLLEARENPRYQQLLLGFRDNKVLELLCKHCNYKE
jgi:MoaA/NifB/PqqE/SkfB family radical SAM enzyme